MEEEIEEIDAKVNEQITKVKEIRDEVNEQITKVKEIREKVKEMNEILDRWILKFSS